MPDGPKREGDLSQVALGIVREATQEDGPEEIVGSAEQESEIPADETDEG